MEIKKLSDIVSRLGFILLTNGAEVHRVEDTIDRVASAYGHKADVFAIPNSLVVTLTNSEGKTFTQTRRAYYRGTNLDTVDRINDLARRICSLPQQQESEIMRQMDDILKRPAYSVPQQLFAAALSSWAFALLFGGSLSDSVAALSIGVIVRAVGLVMEVTGGNLLINNVVGGFFCGFLAMVLSHFGSLDSGIVIISALMLLVPGLTMTNSMRDIIAGDIVSGVMKCTEAALTATGIAVGVICSLWLWRVLAEVLI